MPVVFPDLGMIGILCCILDIWVIMVTDVIPTKSILADNHLLWLRQGQPSSLSPCHVIQVFFILPGLLGLLLCPCFYRLQGQKALP